MPQPQMHLAAARVRLSLLVRTTILASTIFRTYNYGVDIEFDANKSE